MHASIYRGSIHNYLHTLRDRRGRGDDEKRQTYSRKTNKQTSTVITRWINTSNQEDKEEEKQEK